MGNLTTGASAPAVFNFHSNEVRVVMRDGEPWFVCTDVADALGYLTAKDAARHLDDDEKGRQIVPTLGGDQSLTIINESGLYALVLRSRKPEARKFAKWVTGEVLPAIRKTGAYRKDIAPSQIADSYRLASAVVPMVAEAIQETENYEHRRWMLAFTHDMKPYVKVIPSDAMVMSIPQMLHAINEPNGIYIESDQLAAFIVASANRLQRRCKFLAAKISGGQP